MRIAKHTLWRNPSSQPKLTRLAVAAARTYAMQRAEMRVKINDLDDMSTIKPEKPTAIIAAPKAVDSIWVFVSYLMRIKVKRNKFNSRDAII